MKIYQTCLGNDTLEFRVNVPRHVELVNLHVGHDHLLGPALIVIDANEHGDAQLVYPEAAGVALQGVAALLLLLLLPGVLEARRDRGADPGPQQARLGQEHRQRQAAQAVRIEKGQAVERQGPGAAVDDAARQADPEQLKDVAGAGLAIVDALRGRCDLGGRAGLPGKGAQAGQEVLAQVAVVGRLGADRVRGRGGAKGLGERHLGRQQGRLRLVRPAPGVPADGHRPLQVAHAHHGNGLARGRRHGPRREQGGRRVGLGLRRHYQGFER